MKVEKYIYFNNIKFTRDNKTGYYLNSTIRKRLHRYVWEFYNGDIEKGFDIHHKDLNKELEKISKLNELCLLEVKCSIGAREDLGRPTTTPIENKNKFMNYLNA